MLNLMIATMLVTSIQGTIPGRFMMNSLRSVQRMTWLLLVMSLLAGCASNTNTADPVELSTEYRVEDVTYPSEEITLSGILWLPENPGPHPALVIVDGSGKTRAGRLKDSIEVFVDLGFACLSYDKRGVGESGGKFLGGLDIDIPQLGSDAVAGMNFLKTRTEVDSAQIGLLGLSQAGWIIPVAAAESEDVSFTVIFSGTTVTLGEENYYSQLTGDDPFWKYIYRNLSRDEISKRLDKRGPSLFDPNPYLERMIVPGLWLYGELDRSQPTRESVAILDRLIQDHNKDFTYMVFEGADHGIAIDGVLAEGVSEAMEEWLLAHVTFSQATGKQAVD